MGTALDPVTKKITLVELDLAQESAFWSNWAACVWYIDFDMVYDRIDPVLLAGAPGPLSGVYIGSVKSDGVSLASVASVALVESTDSSFFFDVTANRLYVHVPGGYEPSTVYLMVGFTYGFSNHAGYYNGIYYEPRISTAPQISKTKDRLFFGKISIDSISVTIDDADGAYDGLGESGAAIWGAEIRVLQGFDDDAYASFIRLATALVERVQVSKDAVTIAAVDKRSGFSRSIPVNDFLVATYPYLDSKNINASIPLTYGTLKSVPVICTNETQSGPPAQYNFKAADTAGAGLSVKSIDTVYVNGVSVTFTNVSLANATFDITSSLYTPGDLVTVDMVGFETGGNAIKSPADIIANLLSTWLGLTYGATYYNTTEWAATKADVDAAFPDGVGLFIEEPTELFDVIEDICASCMLNLIPQADGKYTLRMYDSARTSSQTFSADELMEVPTLEYDSSEVISSIDVGYARKWSSDSYSRIHDTSRQTDVFETYGKYREKKYDTLLVSSTDAQTFGTAMLDLQTYVPRKFYASFKMQPLEREIMDFVTLNISRATKSMLGVIVAEVLGKRVTASDGVVLECVAVEGA